jgi:hypothetical protein
MTGALDEIPLFVVDVLDERLPFGQEIEGLTTYV